MSVSVYKGLLIDTREDCTLRAEQGILVIQGHTILERAQETELDSILSRHQVPLENVMTLSPTQFLLPGFIDTHIHAPQLPNAGLGLDLPLLEWLEKYTFPTEAKFSQPRFASQVYERCVQSTIDNGTTTAVYFATIHRESSEVLASTCKRHGQRAFVGKVCMDRNSPHYYIEETNESFEETKLFVDQVDRLGGDLVRPILTPRFVPSCSRLLMQNLGALSAERNLHVQTHISENKKEIEWVRNLEPDCSSYTQVYEKCGLLSEKTILAHGVYLDAQELEIIKEAGAGISHCPNSNFSLKSGICDVRRLKDAGVKVGLGTDCSGGYSTSMQDAMRNAVLASNTVKIISDDETYQELNYVDVLHLATRGGASLLDMQDTLGALDPGKNADILVVDLAAQASTVPFGEESVTDLLHKFIFLGDDRNIVKVVVAGRVLKGL